MLGLIAGLGGLGFLMANPRRSTKRKTRKVRRGKRRLGRRLTKRRGAYVVRMRVSSAERKIIAAARSQRMTALMAKRKLTSVGDAILGSHYKVNPRFAEMWLTKGEAAMIRSARSIRMKAVAAKRKRHDALESHDVGYDSYTLDNPRRRRGGRVSPATAGARLAKWRWHHNPR